MDHPHDFRINSVLLTDLNDEADRSVSHILAVVDQRVDSGYDRVFPSCAAGKDRL